MGAQRTGWVQLQQNYLTSKGLAVILMLVNLLGKQMHFMVLRDQRNQKCKGKPLDCDEIWSSNLSLQNLKDFTSFSQHFCFANIKA